MLYRGKTIIIKKILWKNWCIWSRKIQKSRIIENGKAISSKIWFSKILKEIKRIKNQKIPYEIQRCLIGRFITVCIIFINSCEIYIYLLGEIANIFNRDIIINEYKF